MLQLVLSNKAGQTTQKVARILSRIAVGDRIPTVTALTEECQTARGNIQLAINNLRRAGAVGLEAHGQNGTILTDINYHVLANICGVKNLVGSMPLPYTRRYEGLATALFTLLNNEEITNLIAFMRGSEARVHGLLEGRANYCVMSRMAYQEYCRRGTPIREVLDCGAQTYVGRHVLLTRPGFSGKWQGCRVGIDESSVDQSYLTRTFFKDKNVEFVPAQYTQFMTMLQKGKMDVGIWNEDDLDGQGTSIECRPLSLTEETRNDDDRAVIVVQKDDMLVNHLLREYLTVEKLTDVQRQVMSGERVACY